MPTCCSSTAATAIRITATARIPTRLASAWNGRRSRVTRCAAAISRPSARRTSSSCSSSRGTTSLTARIPAPGPTPRRRWSNVCRTGLSANLYGSAVLDSPAGQYNFLQGGNPNLTPEKADSYTIGMVFDQPSNIRGFSATIDYWNIKVKNKIGIVGRAGPAEPVHQHRRVLRQHPSRQPGYPVAGRRRLHHRDQPEPRHDVDFRYRLDGQLHVADPGLGQRGVLVPGDLHRHVHEPAASERTRRTTASDCMARSAARRRRDGVRTSA